MEILVSTILSELMTRSINFVICKCSKLALGMEESLQRALLRAQVIDEEVMGVHITNQGMIQQLGKLRDAIHRGCYALDAFRYPHYGEDDSGDQVVSSFLSLSKVLSAKDACFSSQTAKLQELLQEALDGLSSMIVDLNELVMFLAGNPRLYRQPYHMHIILDVIQKHVSKFGMHPFELFDQNRPVLLGRMATPSEDWMVCRQYHHSSQEIPEIRVQDVLYGTVKPYGKFEVLVWKSPIPPYYSYVCTCEIQERKATGAKRKRSMKHGVTFC